MSDIVIYENGTVSLNAQVQNETIWLSQKQIAKLFDVNVPAISKHMKNIFKSEELIEKSVVSKMEITASDGKIYQTNHYNLDAIISIGYRVNSKQATQFRIWATDILKQHLSQGYTINKERLQKNYDEFLRVVEDIKLLSQNTENVRTEDVLELIKAFSATWFGLDSFRRSGCPLPDTYSNHINV